MSLNACGFESSKGVVLMYKDPADDTYKTLGGLTALPQFSMTHGTATCNTDDAADNGWIKKYKNGKLDAGSVTFDYNWKSGDSIQDLLWPAFISTDASEFRMQWSDVAATKLDFVGLINGFNINTPIGTDDDPKIQRSIPIEISGEPTWS